MLAGGPEPRAAAEPAARATRPGRRHQRRRGARLHPTPTTAPCGIGAMTRQAALERSELVRERWPLLHKAVRLVGHPQIRTRGTVGGSVAHADPAAELPAALIALGARFHVCARRHGGPARSRRRSSSSVRSTPRASRTSCSSRSRCRSSRTARAPASRSTRARTATSRPPARPRSWRPGGSAGDRAAGRGPGAGACRRRRASAGGRRGAARGRRAGGEDVEDEHRRALCTELARRAIEEALA